MCALIIVFDKLFYRGVQYVHYVKHKCIRVKLGGNEKHIKHVKIRKSDEIRGVNFKKYEGSNNFREIAGYWNSDDLKKVVRNFGGWNVNKFSGKGEIGQISTESEKFSGKGESETEGKCIIVSGDGRPWRFRLVFSSHYSAHTHHALSIWNGSFNLGWWKNYIFC